MPLPTCEYILATFDSGQWVSGLAFLPVERIVARIEKLIHIIRILESADGDWFAVEGPMN